MKHDPRLDELLIGYLADGLGETERAELEARLAADPGARRRFAELCSQDLALHDVLPAAPSAAPPRRTRSRRWLPRAGAGPTPWILAAAALLALVGVLASAAGRRRPAPERPVAERLPDPPPPPVEPEPPPPPPPPPSTKATEPFVPPPAPPPRPSSTKATEPFVPPPPAPKPAPTVVEAAPAVARVESLQGPARLLPDAPLQAGAAVALGQGLETGEAGRAVLVLADGTRLDVGSATRIEELQPRRVRLTRGQLRADVVHQPAGAAMVFQGPAAEARVLGTSLRWSVSDVAARLDVTEGKVRLTRLADGRSVDVAAGFYAATSDLLPRPLRMSDVVRIAFGADGPLPEGFALDDGSPFSAARGIGWDRDRRESARLRPGKELLRRRLIVGGGAREIARWELALRNGRYYVTLSCGDVQNPQGPHHVAIEGQVVVREAMTAAGEFVAVEDHPVDVRDGRLTIDLGNHRTSKVDPDGTSDTAINYVIVRRAE